MRDRSSRSRCFLATRTSVPASMRSTSTLVIVFQKARVAFGLTRCLASPSNDTMATSLAPVRTISKCSPATSGCVLASSSALSAAISARTTFTTSAVRRPRNAKVVNRPGPSRRSNRPSRVRNARSSSLTTTVNLNNTTQSPVLQCILNCIAHDLPTQVAGHSPRRDHGPALESQGPGRRARLRPRRSPKERTRRCRTVGPGARNGIRAGAKRLGVCSPGRTSAEASMSAG